MTFNAHKPPTNVDTTNSPVKTWPQKFKRVKITCMTRSGSWWHTKLRSKIRRIKVPSLNRPCEEDFQSHLRLRLIQFSSHWQSDGSAVTCAGDPCHSAHLEPSIYWSAVSLFLWLLIMCSTFRIAQFLNGVWCHIFPVCFFQNRVWELEVHSEHLKMLSPRFSPEYNIKPWKTCVYQASSCLLWTLWTESSFLRWSVSPERVFSSILNSFLHGSDSLLWSKWADSSSVLRSPVNAS